MFWTQELANRLVEVIKTGVVVTDTRGTILFTNRLASLMCGYPHDGLNGTSMVSLFLHEDRAIMYSNIMKLNIEGTGFEGEALLQKKDGTPFFVNLSSALYRGESPTHELVIFTLQDISRLKKMESEKLESERFAGLGAMADQISHQIRNPIVSIGGFALRLAKDQVAPSEYSRYSQIIHAEAKRLEYIIDRLAEFTRTRSAVRSAFSVTELFAGIERIMEPVSEDQIKLVFPGLCETTEQKLFGDLPHLSKALEAIVRNGLEAVHDRGEVTVSWHLLGDAGTITVKDSGEGIEEKNGPFVFDPFFTTKFGYLGLGLTLAKRIVDEHEGRIEIDSIPGQGTTVRLILPIDRRRSVRTRPLRAWPTIAADGYSSGQ